MRIKLGPLITDARGRLGEVVFSIWKTGVQYVRQVANVISNPQSADQMAIRNNLSVNSKAWYDTLTPAQRSGWNDWAATSPGMGEGDGGIYTIIKGNKGVMSGINAFIMAQQWLISAGLSNVQDAPLGLTPPSAPSSVAASYAAPTLTVTWTEPDIHKVDAKVRIWLASHQLGIHKQLTANALASAATLPITNVKGALGASVAIADYPGDYIIQMDTVDTDGTKSPPSNVAFVTVT